MLAHCYQFRRVLRLSELFKRASLGHAQLGIAQRIITLHDMASFALMMHCPGRLLPIETSLSHHLLILEGGRSRSKNLT